MRASHLMHRHSDRRSGGPSTTVSGPFLRAGEDEAVYNGVWLAADMGVRRGPVFQGRVWVATHASGRIRCYAIDFLREPIPQSVKHHLAHRSGEDDRERIVVVTDRRTRTLQEVHQWDKILIGMAHDRSKQVRRSPDRVNAHCH